MSLELFLAFVLACAILALTPGPIVSLVIANGTSYGTRPALLNVAGAGCGQIVLVTIATLGMSSIMLVMADLFDWIRWAGAIYLVWLGASRLWRAWKYTSRTELPDLSGHRWYWQGFMVAISNPKPMLFLGAFFPQFLNLDAPLAPQLVLLAVTFVATVVFVDAAYAVLAGSVRTWFTERRMRLADGISGFVLICGGVGLAALRRP